MSDYFFDDDDLDPEEYRNAAGRLRRHPRPRPYPRPGPYYGHDSPRPRPAPGGHGHGGAVTVHPGGHGHGHAGHGGDYVAIKRTTLMQLGELIPGVGRVWASFLGRPEAPKAIGNDIIDRDNAATHRDALAQHGQNQTRILALTELAGRALTLLLR